MAIGRISGSVLKSNLTRNGVDLAFETNLLYLDVTNSRVGIGTSEPATTLHVNGTITASSISGPNSLTADGSVSITGSSASVVDSFPASTYRSAKYIVSMWDATNSRAGIQEFYVAHDGSSAYISITGMISTDTDMATFSADIDSGNVRVLATLASSDGTVFKFSKILFDV